MNILGLDPSTLNTGWGIISLGLADGMVYVDGGVIKPKRSMALNDRIHFIFKAVKSILKKYQIDHVASESGYVGFQNHKTSMSLQAARTACHLAVVESGHRWDEIKPSEAKRSATGSGSSSKFEVAEMVYITLGAPSELIGASDDLTDALSVAIAHAGNLKEKRLEDLNFEP